MAICKFFARGRCKFGNRCKFEHVSQDNYDPGYQNQQRNHNHRHGRDDYSADGNYNNLVKPSHFQNNRYDKQANQGDFSSPFSRSNSQQERTGFSQQTPKHYNQNSSSFSHQHSGPDKYRWSRTPNRYEVLQEQGNKQASGDAVSEDQKLIETVKNDMEMWKGTLWPYSCYSCDKMQCVDGLADIQAEELRVLFCLQGEEAYKKLMSEVDSMYSRRKQELINMSNETRMAVLTNLHSKAEANPSSCLSIQSLYGRETGFKSKAPPAFKATDTSEISADKQALSTAQPIQPSFSTTPSVQSAPSTDTTTPAQTTQSLFKTGTVPLQQDNSKTSSSANPQYTDMSMLTEPEIEQFKAESFTLGKIPMRPPPVELCR